MIENGGFVFLSCRMMSLRKPSLIDINWIPSH
jgi:hypothetical protein